MYEDKQPETFILPEVRVREGAVFPSISLRQTAYAYIREEAETMQFSLVLNDKDKMPAGISLREEGELAGNLLTGTASKKPYEVSIKGKSLNKELLFRVKVFIYPQTAQQTKQETIRPVDFTSEKAEAWVAISHDLGLPSLQEIVERPISKSDIYYLIGRFALLEVWNASDLSLPGTGKLLHLPEASNKFNVYDFGVCLVTVPVNLFSHERHVLDNVQTAKAIIQEVYKRGWESLEFAGYDRMVNAAWRAVNTLNLDSNRLIDVKNYQPE